MRQYLCIDQKSFVSHKQILVNDVVIDFCDIYDVVADRNNHQESY